MKIIFYTENDKTGTIYFRGESWFIFMIYGSSLQGDLEIIANTISRYK